MGFFSFIVSVGSAICSSISAIGSAVSSFASTVAPVIGSIINSLPAIAEGIGRFANAFLQGLGILKPKEEIQDIGERAIQAAEQGITMDNFSDFDSYMQSLRDFPLDEDVSNRRGKAEKIVSGLAVGTVGVEDKFNYERGSLNGVWLLNVANPGYFTPERVLDFVSTGCLCADIYGYLENRLSGGDARTMEKNMEANLQGKSAPRNEIEKLYQALDQSKERFAEIADSIEKTGN